MSTDLAKEVRGKRKKTYNVERKIPIKIFY